jgi:hypothetical protein
VLILKPWLLRPDQVRFVAFVASGHNTKPLVNEAVVADTLRDQDGFRGELAEAGLPFVMALKPCHGTLAYGPDAHTPADAARFLAWDGPEDPGDWQAVTRICRDGHTQT